MTAFFELLKTYAIFWYLAGVIVVLFGIKMLFDARRAARTTLFTLEQEQASERAFRALLVMLIATVFIGAVAGINAFIAPAVPTPTPDQIQPTIVAFTPPVILPTATPQPTLTLPPPTAVAQATARPTQGAAATATQPVVPPTAPPELTEASPSPTAPPTLESTLIYPAVPLNTPPNGDSIGSNKIQFTWGYNPAADGYDVPESLPPDQFYRLVIRFTDKTKNAPAVLVLCTHETGADQRTGVNVAEYRNEAVDNEFKWNVTIVRAPSVEACSAGEAAPLSPPSSTFTFRLP